MPELSVRVLAEADWEHYRSVRLAALKDAPHAFVSTFAAESDFPEQTWRDRMLRARRLVAEADGVDQGVVCLGIFNDDLSVGDLFGLWVAPEARNTGVSWRLVEAAAKQAAQDGRRQLYYWVGNENARAIAFASNFGFRLTGHRRAARVKNDDFGDQEIAMVLSLSTDPGSVPNPMRPRVAPQPGPTK